MKRLVLAGVVALVGAEVATRLLWHPGNQQPVITSDQSLGWRLQPGSELRSVETSRGLDYTIRVNSLGMRDPEPRFGSGANGRVLFLGDSMVFGAGVPVGQRCGDLLREWLGPDVDVFNAAVGGWGTDQQYLYLCQEGLALQPDTVILGLCMTNDVVDNMLSHEFLGSAPKPRFVLRDCRLVLEPMPLLPKPTTKKRVKHLAQRSRFLHFCGRQVRNLKQQLRDVPDPEPSDSQPYYPENLDADDSHWSIYKTPYSERLSNAFDLTEALIEAVYDSCASRGIPMVLFAFPQKVEVDPAARTQELRHFGYDENWFDLGAPYEPLQRLADRLGIEFVYPLSSFQTAHTDTVLYFDRDPHANASGHKLAAHALMPAVSKALGEAQTPYRSGP